MNECVEEQWRRYTGWLPVVSGNMSFAEIGKPRDCRRYFVQNATDPGTKTRHILIFGRKTSNDGWLAAWLRRKLEKLETRFYYLLVLKSFPADRLERGSLKGFIAFSVEREVLATIAKLVGDAIESAGEHVISLPQEIVDHPRTFGAEVEIGRHGRCDLHFPPTYSRETVQRIADPLFIFIKDASHHHYHHDQKADSITYAHPSAGNEAAWRVETLYALHRAIVSSRRFRTSIKSLSYATGISAYAQAFEERFLSEEETRKHNIGFRPYTYVPIRASIQTLYDVAKLRADWGRASTVFLSSILVAAIALMIGAGRLEFAEEVVWPPILTAFVVYAIEHPVAILIAAFFGFRAALRLSGQDELLTRPAVQSGLAIYTALVFLPRPLLVILLSIFLLALLGLTTLSLVWLRQLGFI